METLLPLLIQVLAGGAGGNIIGKVLKNIDLSKLIQTVVGIIGGVMGGQAAGLLEVLQTVLGEGGAGEILGNAGASGIGGAILVAIVGFIKKASAGGGSAG